METINMIYIGGYSESIQKCIDSFARFHTVDVWEYKQPEPPIEPGSLPQTKIIQVPIVPKSFTNCNLKDANRIFPHGQLHKNLWNIPAITDWVRINLIYQIGGWYSDMDNFCLAPLDFAEPNIFTYINGNSGGLINSIFKCEKGSPILKNLIDTHSFDKDKAAYVEFSDKCKEKDAVYLPSNILHGQMKELGILDLSKTKVIHLFGTRFTARNLDLIDQINIKVNGST